FAVDAGRLASAGQRKGRLTARASSLVFLALHSAVGIIWFGLVAVLLFLSVASGRVLLSARGVHYFEQHLDQVIAATKAATLGVTVSGIYLLFRETAYPTPSSFKKLDAVLSLPYARPYILALAVKIAIYALAVAASFALIRTARSRTTAVLDLGESRPAYTVDPAAIWSERRTTVLEASKTTLVEHRADEPTTTMTRLAGAAIAVSGVTIWICVTLLKYFHELIEAGSVLR
ncbi:MAG: hypothetical protein LC792_05930, partial [Actinobacteria bacterium]|nr:hypothetical protein [Actinomycetota bacterium]